jgi:lipopolysaccharide export system permease protein
MVAPGEVAFFYSFDRDSQTGYRFALEKFEGTQLVSRLTADRASWQGDDTWHLTNYKIRDITERGETITEGYAVDTVVHVAPEDIIVGSKDMEKLTTPALKEYIDKQRGRGVGNIKEYEIEYHKRFAAIATSFILTFLGVCLSSKKIRGGMGINLGIGLVLAFAYILFQTVSSSFAVSGAMSVILAVWLPNLVYLPLCWYVYEKKAPK